MLSRLTASSESNGVVRSWLSAQARNCRSHSWGFVFCRCAIDAGGASWSASCRSHSSTLRPRVRACALNVASRSGESSSVRVMGFPFSFQPKAYRAACHELQATPPLRATLIFSMRNVVIIGSGCAGNTAALYSARANLKPLVVSGHEAGGQLSLTTLVENFPGFPEGINGPDLVGNMKKQAEHFGAEYLHGSVIDTDLSQRPFRLNIEGEWIETRTLIVASGASARWLGLESEQKLIGHGVSSCATCDGFFYRGKKIMVIGGGDSAMEEANFLSRFGSEVTVVHRRDQFRASKIMLDRARTNPKIKFLLNTVVEEIHDVANNMVSSVRLRDTVKNGVWDQEVDGFFVAIGHIPNTAVFRGQIATDADGYILSKGGAKTNIPGVFHAGDVQDRVYKQAVTAAGAGCMAAMEAERYLEAEGH